MPIAIVDKRLLTGMHGAIESCRSLALAGDARAISDVALRFLEESRVDLERAVADEDAAEVAVVEARDARSRTRARVDAAYTRLYQALRMGALERRLLGGDDDAAPLSHYLSGKSPATFEDLGFGNAVQTLARARGFADRFVPERLANDVLPFVDAALRDAEASDERLLAAEAQATQAGAALERRRKQARERYQSARDLLSAALREAGMHRKLGQLMPALKPLLSGAPALV